MGLRMQQVSVPGSLAKAAELPATTTKEQQRRIQAACRTSSRSSLVLCRIISGCYQAPYLWQERKNTPHIKTHKTKLEPSCLVRAVLLHERDSAESQELPPGNSCPLLLSSNTERYLHHRPVFSPAEEGQQDESITKFLSSKRSRKKPPRSQTEERF